MDSLLERIDILASEVWEGSISRADIFEWLANFKGERLSADEEQLHALHLLANFKYFGKREVRELLRSVFRDLVKYPILQKLRTLRPEISMAEATSEWNLALGNTRFLAMGNPSESGAHLLYYFRQINDLPKTLFVNQHEVLSGPVGDMTSSIAIPHLERLIFIDDVIGSGEQAKAYSSKYVAGVKAAAARQGLDISIEYLVLFAKPAGLQTARSTLFDRVETVNELDTSEQAFSADSHVYTRPPVGVTKLLGREVAEHYGAKLLRGHALGYRNGQLLLGLPHNVPDNTIPVIWHEGSASSPWSPAFRRYDKKYH